MNYIKIYNNLIQKSKNKDRIKRKREDKNFIYYEKHHIIPRCLKGDNSNENLVLLTAREHFIAHKLLVEIYFNNPKIFHAYWMMINKISSNGGRDYKISSREYERIKIKFSEFMSSENSPLYNIEPWNKGKKMDKECCEKNSKAHKGIKQSKETIEKRKKTLKQLNIIISEEHKEILRRNMTGRVVSKETREKVRIANIGKVRSKESIQKNIDFLTGKHRSEEIKEKIKNTLTGRKRDKSIYIKVIETKRKNQGGVLKSWNTGKIMPEYICPNCNKVGRGGAMKRYHFDNCKQNKLNPFY